MGMCSKWARAGVVAAVVLAGLAAPASASEAGSRSSYLDGSLRKLGRGIANLATCPLELIRTPQAESYRYGYLEAMSVGLLHGAWRTIQRGAVGAFEILTFYAEIPDHFEPLMMPEFVFANGDWAK